MSAIFKNLPVSVLKNLKQTELPICRPFGSCTQISYITCQFQRKSHLLQYNKGPDAKTGVIKNTRNLSTGKLTHLSNSTSNAADSLIQLIPQQSLQEFTRNTSFFKKTTAKQLWAGVTGVSNAGKKRGRGKGNRRIHSKDLNIGQHVGSGEKNMLWPGLNSAVFKGKELMKQTQLPTNQFRKKKMVELRNKMGVFRPLRLHPLERGWSGSRLPGRSIGPPDPIGEDTFDGFDTKVLQVKTVVRMDGKMGRVRRVSMFVVTGNKNGIAGFALTKATTLKDSLRKARNAAGQKLIYIERCDNHTVFHDFHCRFMKTEIIVKRRPEGYGLVCHRVIREICNVLGIKNLYAKIEGSTSNVQNITKAFFLGLLNQRTHKQLAEEKGLYVVKMKTGKYPEVVAEPTTKAVRARKQIGMDEEMDFNMYTMDGKVEIERKKFVPFYTRLPSWERHLQKMVKCRNHEKIRRQLLVEHGEVASFLTEKHPECRPDYIPPKDD